MPRYSTQILNIFLSLLLLTACSKQSAEEAGKQLAAEKVDMAKGIGDALQDKGGAAADSITTGLGAVLKGVERGVEKSQRKVELGKGAQQVGLQITKVLLTTDGHGSPASAPSESSTSHGLEMYVVTTQAVDGVLKVKVNNALDQEIGRTTVTLKQAADDGRYVQVPLFEQVDLHAVSKVWVDFATQDGAKVSAK